MSPAQERDFDRRLGQLRRMTPPGRGLAPSQIASYCHVSCARITGIEYDARRKVFAALTAQGYEDSEAVLKGRKKV